MYDEANNSMKTTNTTKKTWRRRRRTESNECAKRTAKRFMFTLNLFALLVTNLFESCVGDGFQGMFSGATTFQKKYECDSMVSGSPNSCVCKGENCYLTDGNFHLAVEKCLEEAPRDGLCSKWGTNKLYKLWRYAEMGHEQGDQYGWKTWIIFYWVRRKSSI